MRAFAFRFAGLVLAVALPAGGAQAQIEGLLNKGGAGNMKDLSALGSHSLTSGSVGNVAGLLQYCISNNYLGGDGASSVKDKLMGKVPGGKPESDPGYNDGAKGLLHGSDGKQLDLSGSGLTGQVTKQVCDTVLAQGKSLL